MELENVKEIKETRNLTQKGHVQLPVLFRNYVGIDKAVDVILKEDCIVIKPHKEEKEG